MYSFAKMCRLCLGGDCELNKLLSCDQNSLLDKLSTMFPKLDSTKILPKWMCQNCQRDLNATYKFYLRCLNAHKKLEQYYDLTLTSSLLFNCKKIHNDENVQLIQPQIETYVNNEMQLSLLLSKNSSGIEIKKEIENVPEYSELNEAITSNLEERNMHEIHLNAILSQNSDNIVVKTEMPDVDEYSEFNLNKTELNIDDDYSDRTENDSNGNTEEDSATTIFEPNISVVEDEQLICNYNNQDIQNRNQIFNSDNLFTLNAIAQTFSVESSAGLNLKIRKIPINGNNNNSAGTRYQCHVCTKAYTMEVFLERHLKRIHGYTDFLTSPLQIERIENTIPKEPKKYKYSQREKISSRPMRYRCSLCDKRFCDSSQLRVHHRIHTGERPYTCQTCKKSFNQKQHLVQHQRIHSNERPFTCDICHKSFNSRYVNVHKRIHTGELPFACPICGERFHRTDRVNIHIRVKHTKERPYLCTYCDQTFNDRSNLSRHRLRHHPEIVQ